LILYVTYIVVILSSAYLVLIVYFIRGWKKIPSIESKKLKETPPSVSIIIALHNEEKNAASLLNSLIKQSFKNFELILVDDFSTTTL
jgi:cellulose synthase/poly-beta-1,6-N-acetylglucosamine synthase-like glycosyltransferase